MKTYFNLACVLGILVLQSCNSFSGKRPANYGHAHTKDKQDTTAINKPLTLVSEYNGIEIDTTTDETTFFVNRVDDEKGMAYGSFYQFDNAQATEISVAVPYGCMRWDSASKTHFLIIKHLRKALTIDSLTHMFVQNRTLMGHKYRAVDARM
jgi:hypothetical protein